MAIIFDQDDRFELESDDRLRQLRMFDAVGGFQCVSENGKPFFFTGFIAARHDIVVTSAHTFLNKDGSLQNVSCDFVVIRGGKLIDRISISRIKSPWQDRKYFCDPSNDFSVVKLVRSIDQDIVFRPNIREISGENIDIILSAYHTDITDRPNYLRISRGRASKFREQSFLNFFKDKCQINNPERLYASNYDSLHGSSGGPVWEGDAVVGINSGFSGGYGCSNRKVYSIISCFNYFIAIDKDVADFIITAANE